MDLEQLSELLSAAAPRSSTDRETVSRAIAAVQYARRYRSSNLRLLPRDRINSLTRLQSHASQLSNLIEGWDQSGAMTNSTVSQLDRYVDEILEEVNRWPALPKAERDRVNVDADEAERTVASASLDALLGDVESAREALRVLQDTSSTVEARSQQVVAEAQAATEALQDALREQKAASDSERASAMEEVQILAEAQRVSIKADAESQGKQLLADAKAIIDKLTADEATAKKLLAFVSDGSVSGGYGTYAKSELNAYRLWNILGATTALAGVGYLIWHFQDISGLDISVTITRAALSIPIFGFTAFAFKQATLRHRNSVDATYRALDLLALPPFTDDMPEAERSELRMIMGQRIFSRIPDHEERRPESDGTITPEAITSITALLKTLQNVVK
ncbi:hypothetical protein [Curtobacterium citreum]|uniref:Uncharacterized protein n=1 Tax=Curtobacterium citreum TaxID=2036 RepID=A0ABT2HKU7_9MICO|nr:hypothetical protein [Curtobacterium citreum]MCS6523886.1 hypothetical protein [Curtobacterium citreum]